MRLSRTLLLITVPICLLLSGPRPADAQFSQQGPKLVAAGAVATTFQGHGVALSADGNTALVGAPTDNGGAAWVWTRSGGVWTQQGGKLVGSGAVGFSQQGVSVSLSPDGNTALVGGHADNNHAGAAWVWTRSGGVWTQQGGKLVGAGAVGSAQQGVSVSLSADGNTALVGGPGDNSSVGAAWVWTRSGGVWTQQGPKLVGTGVVGGGQPGVFVSLSADGNTALVGRPGDNSSAGAAWVWTRSGGVWTQQGAKLVATGAVGAAGQGSSVSLSTDGNTALVGGRADNSSAGAAWVWTRSGSVWTQQGAKLVGSGAAGTAQQGRSVALSADGNTALVGGYSDNGGGGAAWVWTRSGSVWIQQGSKLVGAGAVGSSNQGWSAALSGDGNTVLLGGPADNTNRGAAWVFAASTRRRDFDWDGKSDIVWRHIDGSTALWLMNGLSPTSGAVLLGPDIGWQVVHSADVNGDWKKDLVWRHTNGSTAIWLMNGLTVTSGATLLEPDTGWRVIHTGDFNGDSKSDLVWQHTDGSSALWLMDGLTVTGDGGLVGPATGWSVVAVGDFNADRKSDLVWQHTNGSMALWLMDALSVTSGAVLLGPDTAWQVIQVGDFNGDDKSDIVWQQAGESVFDGSTALWLMDGLTVTGGGDLLGPATGWRVHHVSDVNGDGKSDLLWQHANGNSALWLMDASTPTSSTELLGAGTGWQIIQTGDFNGDGKSDLVWQHPNGSAALWLMDGLAPITGGELVGPATGWTPVD